MSVTVCLPDVKKVLPLLPSSVTVEDEPVIAVMNESTILGVETLKVTPLLVPPDVVMVTVRLPVAVDAIVSGTVMDVPLETDGAPADTPVPLTCTVVAPLTKLVPVRVTVTVDPATPVAGVIPVSVGPRFAAGMMPKFSPLLVPADVDTVTVRLPVAVDATVSGTVMEVALITCGAPADTPVPLTCTVVDPLTKLVPVNVTDTVDPGVPDAGVIAVSAGVEELCGATTCSIERSAFLSVSAKLPAAARAYAVRP